MSKQKMIIIVSAVMLVIVSVLIYAFYFDRSVTSTGNGAEKLQSRQKNSGSAASKSTDSGNSVAKDDSANKAVSEKTGNEITSETKDIEGEIDSIEANDFSDENLSDSQVGL